MAGLGTHVLPRHRKRRCRMETEGGRRKKEKAGGVRIKEKEV